MKEWPRYQPPRSVVNRASAANFVLRAHAAKFEDFCSGLFAAFAANLKNDSFAEFTSVRG